MSETGGAQPGSVPPAKTSLAQKIVTQIEAGLFACSDFESATSSYWEGEQGEKGIVLCLAKKK